MKRSFASASALATASSVSVFAERTCSCSFAISSSFSERMAPYFCSASLAESFAAVSAFSLAAFRSLRRFCIWESSSCSFSRNSMAACVFASSTALSRSVSMTRFCSSRSAWNASSRICLMIAAYPFSSTSTAFPQCGQINVYSFIFFSFLNTLYIGSMTVCG